ncbi:hypothetical protein ABPG74_015340 [Tetrahymena malaccensis]
MQELLYSKLSTAVFVSVQKNKFGSIQKVSKNIENIFGYTMKECQNKNCRMLMSNNLGDSHDNLIYRFLNRGSVKENFVYRINPLLARTKKRVLIPISMKLQVGYVGTEDIGISSLITLSNNLNENHLILDMKSKRNSLRIDSYSQSALENLFKILLPLNDEEDYFQIQASKIFPLLPFFIKHLDMSDNKAAIQKTQIVEMIGFFPSNPNVCLIKKQQNDEKEGCFYEKLSEYKNRLIQKIKNFDYSSNKNYFFQCQLIVSFLREEQLQYCQICIHSYTELNLADFKRNQIKMDLKEQFLNYGAINLSSEELEQYFNTSNLSFHKQFFQINSQQSQRQLNFDISSKSSQNLQQQDDKCSKVDMLNENEDQLETKKTVNEVLKIQNAKQEQHQKSLKSTQIKSVSIKLNGMLSGHKNNENTKIDTISNNLDNTQQKINQQIQEQNELFCQSKSKIIDFSTVNSPKFKQIVDKQQIEISCENQNSLNQIKQSNNSKILYSSQNNIKANSQQHVQASTANDTIFLKSTEAIILSSNSFVSPRSLYNEQLHLLNNQKTERLKHVNSIKIKACEIMSESQYQKFNCKESDSMQPSLQIQFQNTHDSSNLNKQKNVQEKSLKKAFIKQIQSRRQSKTFTIMKIFSILSLIGIASLILQKYYELQDQFNRQIKNFEYIPWPIQMRVLVSRINKDGQMNFLLDNPIFQNSTDNKQYLSQQFKQRMYNFSQIYKQNLENIIQEQRVDLVLNQYMVQQYTRLKFYFNETYYIYINVPIIYGMLMHSQAMFYYQLKNQASGMAENFLFENFQNQTVTLNILQNIQEQSVSQSFNEILESVKQLLIISSVVSGLFLVCSYFAFIQNQMDKTKVLVLISTIDPLKILQMNSFLFRSSQILLSDKIKSTFLKGYGDNTNQMKQYQVKILEKKKKLISDTNNLKLYDIKIYSIIMTVFVLIMIYPITNLIITINLINQSNSNQELQATLQNIKAQVSSNIGSFSVYLVAQLYPNLKSTSLSSFKARYYSVLSQNSQILSSFQQNITSQSYISRYNRDLYQNFIFKSFEQNSCDIFNQYYSLYQLSSYQIHDHKNEIIENEIIASHIKNCTKSPYCHCDKMRMEMHNNQNRSHQDFQLERKKVLESEIQHMFDKYLKNQKNLTYVHFSYLYFLQDKIQNDLLLNTQIYELINQNKKNLMTYDIAHLKYILYQNNILQQQNNNLKLDVVFKHEENINNIKFQLADCIVQKLEILRLITEDVIDLHQLELKFSKFLVLRKKTEQSFKQLIELNSFCQVLQSLLVIFESNISFFPNKDIFELNSKGQKIKVKIYQQLFRKKSAAIFISLLSNSFGEINQVSQNFENIFQLNSKSVVGQNCSILMPPSLSKKHNNILIRYLSNGSNLQLNVDQSPLLAINKQGFLFQIKKQYQVFISQKNELGLIGLISCQESYKKQDFLVINLKQLPLKIEACSQNIYERIFLKYLGQNKDYQNINLNRLFPMLPYILKKIHQKNTQNFMLLNYVNHFEDDNHKVLSTFGFLPINQIQLEQKEFVKQVQLEKEDNIQSQFEKGVLSLNKNKLILIKFKMWLQNDEFLDICTIQIQSIKILTKDMIFNSHYETMILDQLKDHCSLSYSINKLRRYLQIKQSQESPSVEFQQSLNYIAPEQHSTDCFKQIKQKEFVSLNELNQSKTQRVQVKTTSFQTIQNEIVQNNEPELLQIENNAHGIFSMSTFYSPRNNTMGEQQYFLQNTARTSDREIAYQISSKNNLVSMQTIQKHQILRQKQSSIKDTDSEQEQSQSLKEEKQNKSSLLETLNQIQSQQKSLPQNVQSVSTSINSSYKVEKLQVYNTFKSINKPLLFLIIRNISMICLVSLLVFILVVFIDLRTSFSINTKNFYYISWGNNLRAERSKCLKSYYVQMILSNPIYGYSDNPNLSLYQNEILSNAAQSYNKYQQFIIQLTHEKMEELRFMNYLFEQQQTTFYYNLQKQTNITTSGIYTLLMDSQTIYQLLTMQEYNPLNEYSVYSRFTSIANLLALIQKSQHNDHNMHIVYDYSFSSLCFLLELQTQNSNQDLQGAILTTKAAFASVMTTYSLLANSILNPNKNTFQTQYSQKFKQLVQLAQSSYQNLTQIVQKQDQQQRYGQDDYDKFVFQILEKDACNPMFSYPQLFSGKFTNLNETTCNQLIDGQLSNGLLNSLSYYLNIMNNIYILHQSKELKKQQELSEYLQKYKLLNLNMASEYLQTIQDILNNFIYNNISDFFNYMNKIQIALLINQFIVLVTVNYMAFFVFFKSISLQMNQAKNSLTIIQMKYIIESPYIMSFQTLIKEWDRPLWVGYVGILLNYCFYFLIMMNDNILRDLELKDYTLQNIRYISIYSEHTISHKTIFFIFFGFNIVVVCYLTTLLVKFMIKPYENLKQPILSVIIQSYNLFIVIPSMFYSLVALDAFSYINISLTILIGFFSSKHQSKYSFEVKDHLSIQNSYQEVIQEQSFFLQHSTEIDWKIQVSATQFDFYIRQIWQDFNTVSRKSMLEDDSAIQTELIIYWHIQSCTKRPFCYCQNISEIGQSNMIKEYLLESSFRRIFLIDYINELFHKFLIHQKNFNSTHLTHLYFLKQCSKNAALLNIKLLEYYKNYKKSMSMQNLSTLEYMISNQDKNISALNIYDVIQFDENISSVAEQELNLMDQKIEFLKCIAQDFIELQSLEKAGVKLCSERDELEKKLKQLYKVNPNNEYLNFLISNYLCCLSFDDSKDYFLRNLKYSKKTNQKIFQAAFSKNSAVVFISLLKDEFAHIKNVSNNFLLNFHYEKRNILDKNVAILMPKSIGMQHDMIISRYVERGFFEEQKIKDLQPLYAINSKGFLIEIQLNLQISLMGLNQIGVSGLIQVNKSLNDYIVITDIINNNLVQASSTQVYNDLFHSYIENQEEYKKIYMSQCIPLLPHVIKAAMLEVNQSSGDKQERSDLKQIAAKKVQIIKSKKIETIAFLPKFRKNGISRLFLKPYDLEQMIRNGLFTLNMNDIYIVQFKVQVTIDEFLNVGQIVFKTIKKIEVQEQQFQSINLLFLEQLKQYCPNCNFTQEEIQSLFFMNDWQTQLFSKINQVVDKYSHHHQSLTHINTIKKQYENQIEEISEEKEEILNQTDQFYQIKDISHRNYINHFQADNLKDDNMLSMQREIGSIDNLMTPKEKQNKQYFSHKQIQIVVQENLNKNNDYQQISSHQNGSKELRSNETTNILSQTSLQSPKYKESQKLIVHSSRGSKNFDFQPISIKQITPNYTMSQSLKKMNSKQLSDVNEKLEAKNEQKNLSDEVQAVHQQSVSSSRNNQYTSIKKIIKNSFEKPSRSRVFNQILLLAVISLIIVGVIIIVFFFNIQHKFDLQTKDFYYIPWGMNIRISISRIFKNHIFEKFTNIPDFGMYNNRDALAPMFNQNKYDQNTYFKKDILEIVQEPMNDLFLSQYITQNNLPVSFYNSDKDFTTLVTRVQPALNFYGIYMFQFANYNMKDPNKSDKLIMINLFNNFLVLIQKFASIQSLQEQNIIVNNDKIQNIVLTLLCLICVISLAFVLTIIPTFAYAQLKKQRVFFLFSTIDPQRIKDMQKVILIASQQIIQYKTKSHQKNLSHFGTSQQIKNHQFKENELINKKKKISSTSQYPKYSCSLILKCLVIYIILIVYPVVNYIITNTLTSQSGENQKLQGLIQTAKAQISSNIATFGLCAHSDLNLSNDNDLFPKYQQRFLNVLKQGPTTLSQFQTSIQQQQQKGRFNQQLYTDFFFNIITSDACAVLQNYPQYFNKTILNYQSCVSTYNSVLGSGLLNAINILSDFFVNAYEIYQISDNHKRYNALVQLIQKSDLLQINNLYEMIIEFMTGLTKFIVETNDEFFSQMNMVQTILMVYQFIVLAIVYQFGLVKYFKNITFQLKRAKHVLTIFEITYLIENSYILNYLSK